MRVIILLSLISFNVFAAPKLANFVPGNYKAVKGAASQCVGGRFVYNESGDGLQLGSLHNFNARTGSMVLPSDIPEEKDCNYDVKDKVEVLGNETIVSFSETLRCPGVIRHVLVRKAKITASKITIEYNQTGNPELEDDTNLKYSCEFVKVK